MLHTEDFTFAPKTNEQLNYSVYGYWTLLRASSPALGSATVAWVRYYMTNFTGSTSPTGCSSNWQWQFIGVWTAVHHRTCRTTASGSPVLTLGGICVPPTVNTCSTSLPAQHLRPSGLFSCWPHQSLELSPRFHPGPDHQCRLFQTFA